MAIQVSTKLVIVSEPISEEMKIQKGNQKNLKQNLGIKPQKKGEINASRKSKIRRTIENFADAKREIDTGKMYFVTLAFASQIKKEKDFEKYRNKIIRKMNDDRIVMVTERGKFGSLHIHCITDANINEMQKKWSEIIESDEVKIFNASEIEANKKITLTDSTEAVQIATTYLLKGNVENQGEISGRLFYVSKKMRDFEPKRFNVGNQDEWIKEKENEGRLKLIGEKENAYKVYEVSREMRRSVRKDYAKILETQKRIESIQ